MLWCIILEKGWLGTVAFKGTTDFSEGEWVGVILDECKGKNNGSVKGKAYFTCDDNYGLFVRAGQVRCVKLRVFFVRTVTGKY